MHWLGNATLKLYVRRAVKASPNTGSWPITAMTWHLLRADKWVKSPQTYPTEEDVYLALMRLMQEGLVERYRDFPTGGIRYRASAYRHR